MLALIGYTGHTQSSHTCGPHAQVYERDLVIWDDVRMCSYVKRCVPTHTHGFSNPWPVGTSEKWLSQTPGCCLSDNLQSSTTGEPDQEAPIPCQARCE